MNEIEPCPFCDSKARVKIRKGYKTKYGIGCSNEDCIIWLPDDVLLKELQNYTTVYSKLEEAIKAWNRRPKSNWISVKDRLPEYGEYVLCNKIGSNRQYVMKREKREISGWHWDDEDDIRICVENYITHWQPLPEPPMENVKE